MINPGLIPLTHYIYTILMTPCTMGRIQKDQRPLLLAHLTPPETSDGKWFPILRGNSENWFKNFSEL